jgi:hypothetical protein
MNDLEKVRMVRPKIAESQFGAAFHTKKITVRIERERDVNVVR